MSGDGCCPAGANNNNDGDCPPVCRNGIVEQGEQCDDGNNNDGYTCNNNCQLNTIPGTAFRMRDLDLRDPHVYVDALGCRDVTDTAFFGFAVNGELQTSIQTDGDSPADGLLDLSIATVFRPLDQSAATNAIEIHFPSCTTPLASTQCSRNPPASPPIMATATNMTSGTCLLPVNGTTTAMYTPDVANATGPCYVSNAVTVTVNIAGIPITLNQARIAATYVGSPASNTVNGLLMGFISETDANNTTLPSSLPLVGGDPLSSLLPGGSGNCAGHSDADMNGGVRGWWFYLNFTAPQVTWVDN
jgi:cysteine-rich repeat protein